MKEGQESRTAVLVCAGRAAAHGRSTVARYSDPTALALLPDDERAAVVRFRESAGPPARDVKARVEWERLATYADLMVARTVAIDDAVRDCIAAGAAQVVILGAGLDGRAWRMRELAEAIVFEVDHPDSQRRKRERAAALSPAAREVRFVPVDFTRDSLDEALAKAGHDPSAPTMWIWEGVVMYLTRAATEATLAVIEKRSAPRSALAIAYHAPALTLLLVGALLRRLGEPLKSRYTPAQMAALLATHGLRVALDESLPDVARRIGVDGSRMGAFVKHGRLVIAHH